MGLVGRVPLKRLLERQNFLGIWYANG